ncbi:MAG: M48 family metallopeptidase [Proteobacteria bacterium]|nr:M48 family metallopeptidase [Pseudomonadota bacterium]
MIIIARKLLTLLTIVMLVVIPMIPRPAEAQGLSLLRDAETEWFLREISTPFFEAAGLNPSAVSIYLIHDSSMNAFVTLGQIMAIYSGLIQSVDNVNQLEGVIAHETGHIAGGHAVRYREGQKAALKVLLVHVILGLAAAVAGSPDAAAGLLLGGQSMAQRVYLSYSRVQESTADQAAMTYLNTAGVSARGMIEFFDKIRDQELLTTSRRDPYVRTHPLSGDRILRLIDRAQASPYYDVPSSEEKVYWFKRIRAKIDGFIYDPEITLRLYPVRDQSLFARYARVYAYQKALRLDDALAEATSLINENPDDPYFQEIAGQILFEFGRIEQSLPYLRRAHELLPREPLIMTALGHALVAMETPETDREAVEVLELAVFFDRQNGLAWRQLAVVYARTGRENMANLATAEMFSLQGRYRDAVGRAQMAFKTFPEGTREWVQAQDLIFTATAEMEKHPEQNRKRR